MRQYEISNHVNNYNMLYITIKLFDFKQRAEISIFSRQSEMTHYLILILSSQP